MARFYTIMASIGKKSPGGATNTPRHGPRGGALMDTNESSVFRPTSAEQDTHPHACTEGVVYLTYVVFVEEIGAEVERSPLPISARYEEAETRTATE
jgi:hypothetical protein